MFEEVEQRLAGLCSSLDPDLLAADQVAGVHASLTRIAKLVDGAKLRLARRVDDAGLWSAAGDASAVDYLARTAGTTKNEARQNLDTSWAVTGLAATDAALRDGRLSAAQAAAVTDGAQADPDAETGLLDGAATDTVSGLRRQVAATKAAADPDPAATARRLHAARRLRRFTGSDGLYHLHLQTTLEHGAHIDAARQPAIDELFSQARSEGRREPVQAYAADALVGLLTDGPAPPAGHPPGATDAPADPAAGNPAAGDRGADDHPASQGRGACRCQPARPGSTRRESKVLVHIDAAALTRGSTLSGERCEIAGVGPVPVAAVRALLPEAFVAAVITDAVDVRAVAHLGRQVSAHQRTALQARGYRCEVPHCPARHRLEIDHITGWAITRTTSLDDLAWLCPTHHHHKTDNGWRLHGPPRKRRWTQATVPPANVRARDP